MKYFKIVRIKACYFSQMKQMFLFKTCKRYFLTTHETMFSLKQTNKQAKICLLAYFSTWQFCKSDRGLQNTVPGKQGVDSQEQHRKILK